MVSVWKLDSLSRFFMKFYGGKHYKTSPHTPLCLPLNECRVALITTAGFFLDGQPPFEKGDCSYREIPNAIQTQVLINGHKSAAYDERGLETDPNLAFPLDRFRELEIEGKIGALNHRHFSFMGSIIKPKSLIEKTAPEVGHILKADDVDVAFLTPV
ncbi:MAG: glycine/sarcosine/betaine reductase selenoprotein B family protein [Candidatus Poribacteria bacterium]|nr:glycine/sarcosine/betaine reductase selenoprotein B family protein [Candidatus Poribacteria bacterium]